LAGWVRQKGQKGGANGMERVGNTINNMEREREAAEPRVRTIRPIGGRVRKG